MDFLIKQSGDSKEPSPVIECEIVGIPYRTYKWRLKRFVEIVDAEMRLKSGLSKDSHPGKIFAGPDEFSDIESWPEDECHWVYHGIRRAAGYGSRSASDFNPWCVRYARPGSPCVYSCVVCGYGKRNGHCGDTGSLNSRYGNYRRRITLKQYQNIFNKIEIGGE